MPKDRTINLSFPLAGVDRSMAYQAKRPYTTIAAQNVESKDPLERRERGGSRGGLAKTFAAQLGGGNPVRMLETMRTVRNVRTSTTFTDTFANMNNWTIGPFDEIPVTAGLGNAHPQNPAITPTNGCVLGAKSVDQNQAFSVRALVLVGASSVYELYAGFDDTTPTIAGSLRAVFEYSADASHVKAHLYTGNLRESVGGPSNHPGSIGDYQWVEFSMDASGVMRATVAGNQLTEFDLGRPTVDGTRIGFSLTQNNAVPRMDTLEFEYFTPQSSTEFPVDMVVASANGLFYRQQVDGTIAEIADAKYNNIGSDSAGTDALASDRMLQAVDYLGKLYIADHDDPRDTFPSDDHTGTGARVTDGKLEYGTQGDHDFTTIGQDKEGDVIELTGIVGGVGVFANLTAYVAVQGGDAVAGNSFHLADASTGTDLGAADDCTSCNYRIVRSAKYYDSSDDTLNRWVATDDKGDVPVGCTIIIPMRDACLMTGDPDNPGVWYMCRKGSVASPIGFFDWDYAPDLARTDYTRALAANNANSETGGIALPVSAATSWGDDYTLLAAEKEIWFIRGDPALAGELDQISGQMGIVDRAAICRTPDGGVVFLTYDGLYKLRRPPLEEPIYISGNLPNELLNVDPTETTVTMSYDSDLKLVMIFLTSNLTGATTHYRLNWETGYLWPMYMASDHNPFSVIYAVGFNAAILGCRDGYLRHFQHANTDDDGTQIDSAMLYGPIRLGADNALDGMVYEIQTVLDAQSGDAILDVYVADDPEAARRSSPRLARTITAGYGVIRPRLRGHTMFIGLRSSSGSRWAIDRLTIKVRSLARLRT